MPTPASQACSALLIIQEARVLDLVRRFPLDDVRKWLKENSDLPDQQVPNAAGAMLGSTP